MSLHNNQKREENVSNESQYFLRGRAAAGVATFGDIAQRSINTAAWILGFFFLIYIEFVLGALALQDIIAVSFPLFWWELTPFGFALGLSTLLSLIVIYTHDTATLKGTRSVRNSSRDEKLALYIAMSVNLVLDLAYIPVLIGNRDHAAKIVPHHWKDPKYILMFVLIVMFNLFSQPLRRKMLNVFRREDDEDDVDATVTPLSEVA